MTKTEAMNNEAIAMLLARATRAMNRANELERINNGAANLRIAKCDGRWEAFVEAVRIVSGFAPVWNDEKNCFEL